MLQFEEGLFSAEIPSEIIFVNSIFLAGGYSHAALSVRKGEHKFSLHVWDLFSVFRATEKGQSFTHDQDNELLMYCLARLIRVQFESCFKYQTSKVTYTFL